MMQIIKIVKLIYTVSQLELLKMTLFIVALLGDEHEPQQIPDAFGGGQRAQSKGKEPHGVDKRKDGDAYTAQRRAAIAPLVIHAIQFAEKGNQNIQHQHGKRHEMKVENSEQRHGAVLAGYEDGLCPIGE